MLGNHHIKPRSQVALDAIVRHGSIMGVEQQRGTEVLLFCATPTCACWAGGHRWRKWFRLQVDVELGSIVLPS